MGPLKCDHNKRLIKLTVLKPPEFRYSVCYFGSSVMSK